MTAIWMTSVLLQIKNNYNKKKSESIFFLSAAERNVAFFNSKSLIGDFWDYKK